MATFAEISEKRDSHSRCSAKGVDEELGGGEVFPRERRRAGVRRFRLVDNARLQDYGRGRMQNLCSRPSAICFALALRGKRSTPADNCGCKENAMNISSRRSVRRVPPRGKDPLAGGRAIDDCFRFTFAQNSNTIVFYKQH